MEIKVVESTTQCSSLGKAMTINKSHENDDKERITQNRT